MTDVGDTTIGTRTARAAVWSLLAISATRVISLVSLIILARLLAPRDFGLLTFALVYITYIETIGDLGTGVALIYWPNRKEDAAQVTFWINIASGSVWFLLTWLLAPQIAGFFNSPHAVGIVRLLAWSFPIKYLGNTHDALAQKELRFRDRLVPEIGLAATKALLSIGLARAGFGATSLVIGHLGGLVCWTALLWVTIPWRPKLQFPKDLAEPMLRYGRGLMAVNVLAAVIHHADLAIVGRMLGATVLGFYQLAARIPEMSITLMIWVAGKVLFPAFSAVHAAGRDLKAAYLSALRYMSLLTVPAAIGLAAIAEPVVVTFFGEKWRGSIPVLRALAIYAGMRALGAPSGDLLKATGRSGLLARLALLKAAVLLPALIAAGTQDATTVAIALLAVTGLTMLLNLGVAGVLIGVSVGDIWRAVHASLITGVVLASAIVLVDWLVPVRVGLKLLILVPAGALAYAGLVAILDREALVVIRQKLWRPKEATPEFRRVGRYLLPTGNSRSRRYFFSNLYVPHGTRERVMRAVAPSLLMRPAPGSLLSAEWLDLLHEITAGESWRPIILTDYEESGRSRVVCFLFRPGDVQPFVVAKLRPLSGSGSTLRSEWDALKFIETLPRDIRDTVPAPLDYRRSSRFEVLLTSHLPGRSAYAEMHDRAPERHVRRHFDAAADWLARFHLATGLDSHSMVHGDFWARNLLTVGAAATGVVDWEHFARSGSPFEDLFHFPLSYGLNYPRNGRPLEAFTRTFVEPTAISAAVRRYLERYCGSTGMEFAASRDWFETYLLAKGGDESKLPWRECLQILQRASRSVFSG